MYALQSNRPDMMLDWTSLLMESKHFTNNLSWSLRSFNNYRYKISKQKQNQQKCMFVLKACTVSLVHQEKKTTREHLQTWRYCVYPWGFHPCPVSSPVFCTTSTWGTVEPDEHTHHRMNNHMSAPRYENYGWWTLKRTVNQQMHNKPLSFAMLEGKLRKKDGWTNT